ncbi:MAG: bifunctional ornithine acetyltransferase/N-acetylglutamate synthase, partial [bacterium]
AKMMAKDGEGATKLVEVQVKGALTEADAKKTAMAIANSNLVKTAIFGEDANWGRVIAAVGYSGAEVDPDKIEIVFASEAGKETMALNGQNIAFSEENASRILAEKELIIMVDLHLGQAEVTAWTCDFSYDYVKINGSYRS